MCLYNALGRAQSSISLRPSWIGVKYQSSQTLPRSSVSPTSHSSQPSSQHIWWDLTLFRAWHRWFMRNSTQQQWGNAECIVNETPQEYMYSWKKFPWLLSRIWVMKYYFKVAFFKLPILCPGHNEFMIRMYTVSVYWCTCHPAALVRTITLVPWLSCS